VGKAVKTVGVESLQRQSGQRHPSYHHQIDLDVNSWQKGALLSISVEICTQSGSDIARRRLSGFGGACARKIAV
jgi:hypothetical protein